MDGGTEVWHICDSAAQAPELRFSRAWDEFGAPCTKLIGQGLQSRRTFNVFFWFMGLGLRSGDCSAGVQGFRAAILEY
jgi:hypothetical protein